MVAALHSRVSRSLLKGKRQLLPSAPLRTPYPLQNLRNSHRTIQSEQHSRQRTIDQPSRASRTSRTCSTTTRIASPQSTFTKRTFTTTSATATNSEKQEDITTTTTTTMAASDPDQDYMAFLNKANEDPSKGAASSSATATNKKNDTTKKKFRTRQDGVEVPAALSRVCDKGAFYVSDADEPFEVVALGWDEGGRGLPDEEEFAGLIEHWDPKNAEIEILDPVDWDSNGQYNEVIDAVREAGEGNDVRVYKVTRDGVRAEYFVVTTEGKGKGAKLVGVKALSVES